MKKEEIAEFVKMMNSHAADYGAQVSLVSSGDHCFVVRVEDEDLGAVNNEDGECHFKVEDNLLCLFRLYGRKVNEGEGWLVSQVPAAAFALCWAGA